LQAFRAIAQTIAHPLKRVVERVPRCSFMMGGRLLKGRRRISMTPRFAFV
jgi:hypothetical protein